MPFNYPSRVCSAQKCARPVPHMKVSEQAQQNTSPAKIHVTSKSPVGDIPVVTLIRTDTTLDHSQKAEKVCAENIDKFTPHITGPNTFCLSQHSTRNVSANVAYAGKGRRAFNAQRRTLCDVAVPHRTLPPHHADRSRQTRMDKASLAEQHSMVTFHQ